MKFIKKSITLILLLSLMNIYLPLNIHATEKIKKMESDIIEYEPESSTTVEKKLPSTGCGSNWLWAIIVAILIGGVAVALGGGSDTGGSGDDNTGDLNYSW